MADNSDSNPSPDSYQQLGAADEVRRAKNWLSSPVYCISDLEEFIAKFEEHFDLQTYFHRQYNSSADDTDFDVIEFASAEAKASATSDKMLDLSFHIGHLFRTMELCQANGPDAFPFDAAAIQEVRTALLMVPLSKDKSVDRGEAIYKLKSAIFRFRSFALGGNRAAVAWSNFRSPHDWRKLLRQAGQSASETQWRNYKNTYASEMEEQHTKSVRITKTLATKWGLHLPEFSSNQQQPAD